MLDDIAAFDAGPFRLHAARSRADGSPAPHVPRVLLGGARARRPLALRLPRDALAFSPGPHQQIHVAALVDARFLAKTDAFQFPLANDKDFLATRAAYKLNLRGPA